MLITSAPSLIINTEELKEVANVAASIAPECYLTIRRFFVNDHFKYYLTLSKPFNFSLHIHLENDEFEEEEEPEEKLADNLEIPF